MSNTMIAILSIGALFVSVLSGVPIGFSLLLISFIAMALITNIDVAFALLEQTAASAVNDYVFAVVPLFIIMGAFMTNSRTAGDLYALLNRMVQWIRGGLGIATVFANAIFASVTGVSVASAAVFSKISYPHMVARGYSRRLALGCVAGSSVLGMLIPPSLLLILFGILTQVSIGALFIAGIIPGLVLSVLYSGGIVLMGFLRPQWVGLPPRGGRVKVEAEERAEERAEEPLPPISGGSPESQVVDELGADLRSATEIDYQRAMEASFGRLLLRAIPIGILILAVIGGIWGGVFTPTEASGIGALGALVIGVFTGMTRKGFVAAFKETAGATGSILFLLIAAQMYSRMLASSGLIGRLGRIITSWEISHLAIIALFCVILVLLGGILDSSSIILLTVPLMFPVVQQLGLDPVWFGIVMIVAVEIGMLTPPFGMVPFAMMGVLEQDAKLEDIFIGAFPFVIVMVLFVALLILFPALSTWLPGLL